MSMRRCLFTAVLALGGALVPLAHGAPAPLRIAYLAGNAGEIDPCG